MLRCLPKVPDFIIPFQSLALPTFHISSVSHCLHKHIELNSPCPTDLSDYIVLLQQCTNRKSLWDLRRTHLHMHKSGFPHLSLGNKLIQSYLKCGSIEDASNLFDEMPQRHIVTWNSMISAYVCHGLSGEAIGLFERMCLENVFADEFTFSIVFKAFSDMGLVHGGRKAHGLLVVLGVEVSDAFVGSGLVDMYAKFGRLRDARLVCDRVVEKDVVLLTALIVGCTQHGENGEALEVFRGMIVEGIKANDFTFSSILIACGVLGDRSGMQIHGLMVKFGYDYVVACRTSLVTMYSKCGSIDDSLKVFERCPGANLVTWTALITGLVQNGREESSLLMFKQMVGKSLSPNAFTLSSVLRACSVLAMYEQGQQIHCIVFKTGLHGERYVGAALIDMYGKCGSIGMARLVFDSLDKRGVVLINSMINSYAQSGYGEGAVELFDHMRKSGIEPNDATFLSVLSACSNAGLVEEGCRIFSSLQRNSKLDPSTDHYACVVDLLGRAGRLEEAENLIKQVEEPDVVLWRTLLSACRIHGKVEMARRVMTRVLELDQGNEGAHVLLSNIFASAGEWSEVSNMKIAMKDMKLKKSPGMSWIKVDREVHTFMAGDPSHPSATEINEELERLREKIESLGYVPDVRFVLQDLNEEEKKRSLYYHSEKIAIAFGLLSNKHNNTCIRIFKNLRVCGDCHNWIKYVSKVSEREIIARDAKRFHHFTDGMCSCGDHW
ncbi:hypothetical protein Scep_020429 [Stephania cephalantha]|uniref:DYW domain-containing protein n=1 Tax=Stephania cephalantha TaxID=152367 RepID=A0AAP0ICT2_9MAGN